MRWPIRHQILLPFAIVTFLVVLAVSVLSAYLAAQRAEQRVERQVRRLGQTLLASSFPLTDAVLEQMHGLSGAHFALVDADGQVIATSRPDVQSLQLATPPVDDWRRLRLGSLVRMGDDNYFASALTMARRGSQRRPAVLHLLYPEAHWSSSRREAALPPLIGGFATLCLSVLLSALIAGRISRRIGRLRGQVMRLAAGDFSTLRLPARDDELRDLAGSVNLLAEQLIDMRRAIRRAERLALLGQLSGGLAHHLRNDITGTRMAVQLHQRRCADDGESLAVALRQLELTEQHLQRLLSAGQPETPCRARCNVREIVEHVVELVEPSCRHRELTLSFVPIVTTDRGPNTFQLEADADQLWQLLMNLMTNAIEAAEGGGWVRVELENGDAALALRVLDSGIGPSAEMAGQLFELFVTTKSEGVGLGLAVARRIAESHGGTLNYARRNGHTCFELLLPHVGQTARPELGRTVSSQKENAWLTC
jgi:signal transduction histidine kinase